MRDYDPTTGRTIQADPLGLVDGASVYGYALQNPGRYVDPRGEFVGLPGCILGASVGFLASYTGYVLPIVNDAMRASREKRPPSYGNRHERMEVCDEEYILGQALTAAAFGCASGFFGAPPLIALGTSFAASAVDGSKKDRLRNDRW